MTCELYEREKPILPEDYIRVDHVLLKSYVAKIFEKLGVRKWEAETVADVLVTADLFGISSHGVQRTRRYVDGIRAGNINIRARPKVIVERGAIAVIDSCNGLGQPVSVKAMDLAVEKAKNYGVSLVLVRNSNHFGIAGYYSLKAVEKGFIGIAITNSVNLVTYTNTIERIIGTNPIAVGIPKREPPPILFDAATSVVPVGKIEIYSKQNKVIPPGWVIDFNGNILHGNAEYILRRIRAKEAALLPLGGLGEEHGGHKGSGLSFIIDIISGVLSGAAWSIHVGYTVGEKPSNVGHAFMAIDIEAFMPIEEFFNRLQQYVNEIKSARKHPDADRIWIPGEKAWYTMITRKKIGIPLHKNVYRELIGIGKVGVEMELKTL